MRPQTHNAFRYIELKTIEHAQVKIRDFYYTDTLAVSVSQEVKKDVSLARGDTVLFYFVIEDMVLETAGIPVKELVRFEEVWIKRPTIQTEIYVNDTFDLFSYFIANPF